MALSGQVKNFSQSSITIADGTAVTPLDCAVTTDTGSFSLTGVTEKLREVAAYERKGLLKTLSHTNRTYPQISLTCHLAEFTNATADVITDMVLRKGLFAAAVSTLGTATGLPYTLKWTFTIEGTDFGDSADHSFVLNDVYITSWDFTEGDPDTISMTGIVYGAITGGIVAQET